MTAHDASAFAKGLYWGRIIAIGLVVIAVIALIVIVGTQTLPDVLNKQ